MSSRLRTLLAAATLLATTATTATAADPEWIRQFGTRQAEFASGVATGPDGRVHVVGSTFGRFFGGANKGSGDVLVTTFDGDGRELWRRQPGTTGQDEAVGVATDADGNVYVVGYTYGALGGAQKSGDYAADAFVIKFDRDGRIVWKRQPGTSAGDVARGVATDADGNVYVVGVTRGALGSAYKGGEYDAFVIKFDRDGRYVWKRQLGTSSWDEASAVATDADGNVFVVGGTVGALAGTKKGTWWDAFVLKFDRDGRYAWRRQPGTSQDEYASGVATDVDGNVFVVGHTDGALAGPSQGGADAFVIKYDRDGGALWSSQWGTTEYDYATAVATDAIGEVYVMGLTRDLGIGRRSDFLIKYARDGRILRSDQPASSFISNDVATASDGSLYMVGSTPFGQALPGNTNLGREDAFLIKYGPDGPQ